eukprot:scaffold2.g6863.t1
MQLATSTRVFLPKAGRAQLACRTMQARRSTVSVHAAARPLWAPGVEPPPYLDGTLAGDYGWDPMGLGANPERLTWYYQGELQNGRWAMLGVAGILVQEVVRPDVWWYNAGLPENIPDLEFGGKVNLGGLLAWEFLLFHFVEVRRWVDIKKHGSVNDDPIHAGRAVANPELGYPGFDPLGLSKGDFKDLKTREIKNGRLAMVAFAAFTLQAQATGKGPLANLADHLSNPFANNWLHNMSTCKIRPARSTISLGVVGPPARAMDVLVALHVSVSKHPPPLKCPPAPGISHFSRVFPPVRTLRELGAALHLQTIVVLPGSIGARHVASPAPPSPPARPPANWPVPPAYGIYACNGVLFNHESPLRGETFVTRKITRALARIKLGLQACLYLGNLDARRDWGHARDYVEMQWLMLQQARGAHACARGVRCARRGRLRDEPRDYVIATGQQYSVREFVELACGVLGVPLQWQGEGADAKARRPLGPASRLPGPSGGGAAVAGRRGGAGRGGRPTPPPHHNTPQHTQHTHTHTPQGINPETGATIIAVDPRYFRPTEARAAEGVDTLLGDPTDAKSRLGWTPKTSFAELVKEMVEEDLLLARRDQHSVGGGFQVYSSADKE